MKNSLHIEETPEISQILTRRRDFETTAELFNELISSEYVPIDAVIHSLE